jgi:hypothetical protein
VHGGRGSACRAMLTVTTIALLLRLASVFGCTEKSFRSMTLNIASITAEFLRCV